MRARTFHCLGGLASLICAATLLTGCAEAPAADIPTATFTDSSSDPKVVDQIVADSAWLQKNRLQKHPAKVDGPQLASSCPEDKVKPHGHRQILLPADLVTTLALHDAKPWAFVRYDIDSGGSPINLRIESSAGLKSFDNAALDTVTSWRFDLQEGMNGAYGCLADVTMS
jgi:TonB family protein